MTRPPFRGLAVFAFALGSPLVAQQSPLAPEHVVLKLLEGDWTVAVTRNGAPAGQAASEQNESSVLVCGGLWLETVTRQGNSEMLGLTGFDPAQKKFVRVSSVSPAGHAAAVPELGEWDAAKRTITWRNPAWKNLGLRTVVTVREGEPPTEVVLLDTGNGSERTMNERKYARAKAGAVAQPKEPPAKAPTPAHELFVRLAGELDLALTATIPGLEKPIRGTGRMREELVSDGWWLRSSLQAEVGTDKVEGRGLMGFDAERKCYVRFWVDSGSGSFAISTCKLDESGKKLTGSGTLMMGGEVTSEDEAEIGDDLRRATQRLKTADGKDAGTFVTVLTRRPAPKAK